uniref:Neurotransmitter-gated ion-channel transmembrane domain-containing protein n=1 Tax=Anopheles merus TaxID=30066 RepID=A0A182VBW0_ANOME
MMLLLLTVVVLWLIPKTTRFAHSPWVELYRTLADTVATYRAGGQLASTRLNLKLLPKFRPVLLLLLLLLTVLDSFFLLLFPARNQSEAPMPRGENMVRAARAAQAQRQNE